MQLRSFLHLLKPSPRQIADEKSCQVRENYLECDIWSPSDILARHDRGDYITGGKYHGAEKAAGIAEKHGILYDQKWKKNKDEALHAPHQI